MHSVNLGKKYNFMKSLLKLRYRYLFCSLLLFECLLCSELPGKYGENYKEFIINDNLLFILFNDTKEMSEAWT